MALHVTGTEPWPFPNKNLFVTSRGRSGSQSVNQCVTAVLNDRPLSAIRTIIVAIQLSAAKRNPMSSLRLLRCTVRRPVTLPSSLRSLCASYNITSRSVYATAFQRLALDHCSRRPAGFRAPFGVSYLSTSPYHDDDAQKTTNGEEKRLQSESKLMAKQVYQAPMSRAVRLMKAVSVTSCALTSIGMPVLCLVSEQDTSAIGKVSE